MSIQKMLVGSVILASLVTIGACKDKDSKLEPAEIHILFPSPDAGIPNSLKLDEIYTAAASNFEKINPQIKVIVDHVPAIAFTSKDIIKRLKSEDSADIVPFDMSYLKLAEKEDVLVDLNTLERSTGANDNDTFEGITEAIQLNGKRLVMPYAAVPLAIMYNKSLLDDASIPYPQGDWTWENFAEITKKMNGSKGSGLPFIPFIFDAMLESLGKSMISPEGNTALGFMDSPEAVHTVKWLNDYYHGDKANDKKDVNDDMSAGMNFNQGQTAMVIGGLDSYTFYKTNLGDKLGVAPLPHFEGGKRINPIYYLGFGISKNSKHPEAALAFMKYFIFTKHDRMDELANYMLLVSKSMSEATHQNTDPIKSLFVNELSYAVKPSVYNNPLLFESWNNTSVLNPLFLDLYTVDEQDIPERLHKLAQAMDQEIKRLENETESTN